MSQASSHFNYNSLTWMTFLITCVTHLNVDVITSFVGILMDAKSILVFNVQSQRQELVYDNWNEGSKRLWVFGNLLIKCLCMLFVLYLHINGREKKQEEDNKCN